MSIDKVGIGYDIHRLIQGRPLILGGITIPFDKGCDAHSDGDALAHALIDALLGALALGNIGEHFPDSDPAFKGADSMTLLDKAVDMVRAAGYAITHIDANIIAEAPKLNPYVQAIRDSLAARVDVDVSCVSVKPKTNEGVGPEGLGHAISTQVVVSLIKLPQ